MTDQDLLQAYAAERDAEAFRTFVQRHEPSVLRFATRFLGSRDAAQDVAQETFIKAAQRPQLLFGVQNCSSWLLRVCRNLGVDHIRKASRRRKHTEVAAERRSVAHSRSEPHTAAIERRELKERMQAEIEHLAPRHREVLLLRIQEGKSYKEIAAITGLTATHVGQLLHHAVKALTRRMKHNAALAIGGPEA